MKRGNIAYLLRIPDDVASLVRGLHPLIKSQIRSALQTLLDDPLCGKSLKEELQGLRSYRVKKFRIIYRVARKKKELEIIAIGPRRNIYEETFKIVSKES
jgi:mRNA interferase RelE/StbE